MSTIKVPVTIKDLNQTLIKNICREHEISFKDKNVDDVIGVLVIQTDDASFELTDIEDFEDI